MKGWLIMSQEIKDFFEKSKKDRSKMKELTGDMVSGFAGLYHRVMQDGALPRREKELIALGIGVAHSCVPCIRDHVENCLNAGATKEQILEAASVAVMMGGGPAYTHIPVVIDTLETLMEE
jgi:AhpD family alkylhydroperoxidase